MSPVEIALVKESFRRVAPIAEQAAALFYARLFELDPSLRPIFQGNMTEQGQKLMALIAAAVGALDRFEIVEPVIRQLGVRHAAYGVTEEHYSTVGTALIWTLEKTLGPQFTPETRAAWESTYAIIANTMIGAAHAAEVAA